MQKLFHLVKTIFVRGAGSAGNFVLLVLTARLYGAAAAGILFNVIAVGYTLAAVANLGLSRFTLRNVPCKIGSIGKIETKIGEIQTVVVILSVVLMVVGVFGYIYLITYATETAVASRSVISNLPLGFILGGGLLFLLGTSDVLKTQGQTSTSILIEVAALPWFSIIILSSFHLANFDGILIPSMSTVLSVFLLSMLVLWRFPQITWQAVFLAPKSRLARSWKLVFHNSTVLSIYWASGSLVMVSSRMTALAAPFFLIPTEIGFVAALVGITSLGGSIIAAAQAYFAPRFAQFYAADEKANLRNELFLSQIVVGGFFLPIIIPVMFAPSSILGLFGSEFSTFPGNLLILAVSAQLLRCASGCSEIFLAMTSKPALELGCLALAILVFWGVILLGTGTALTQLVIAYAAMLASRAVFSYSIAWVILHDM